MGRHELTKANVMASNNSRRGFDELPLLTWNASVVEGCGSDVFMLAEPVPVPETILVPLPQRAELLVLYG